MNGDKKRVKLCVLGELYRATATCKYSHIAVRLSRPVSLTRPTNQVGAYEMRELSPLTMTVRQNLIIEAGTLIKYFAHMLQRMRVKSIIYCGLNVRRTEMQRQKIRGKIAAGSSHTSIALWACIIV